VPPIRLLFASAVLNGLLAPPLVWIILVAANDVRIMGKQRNGRFLNIVGILTAVLMSGAALALLALWWA
jgi:Mn2+/Fe2+ NRAMP family transporter